MRPSSVLLLLGIGLTAAIDLSGAPNGADASDCVGTPVTVFSGSSPDRALVCEGAARAVEFLHAHGFDTSASVRVLLRDSLQGCCDAHIGFYDANSDSVELLTFAASAGRSGDMLPFGVPMDEGLYVSFAVHELAHAVAQKNFAVVPAPPLAQEYIAYVTQFSTMQSALRTTVLSRYNLDAFEHPGAVSLLYYYLDPCAFGVKVYLHFVQLQDGTAFLNDLISGRSKLGGRNASDGDRHSGHHARHVMTRRSD